MPDQGWMDVEANFVVADKQVSNNWAIIHEKSKERFLFFSVSSTFMPDDTGGIDYSVVLQFPEIKLKDNEVALHKFDKEVVAVLPPWVILNVRILLSRTGQIIVYRHTRFQLVFIVFRTR